MAGAGVRQQANALMRKNWAIQRKSICINIVLVAAPIFFCVLLAVLQAAINGQLDTADNKCGCECLRCCDHPDNASSCHDATPDRPCLPDVFDSCETYNKSNCGLQYSSADQAGYCPILYPSSWPPVQRAANLTRRANSPNVTSLYTGRDKSTADALAALMYPQPVVPIKAVPAISLALLMRNASMLGSLASTDAASSISPDLQQAIRQYTDPHSGSGGALFQLEPLSLLGLVLGSSSDTQSNMFIEPAFTSGLPLDILVTDCAAQNLTSGEIINLGGNGTLDVSGISFKIQCSDVERTWLDSPQSVNEVLFCGFEQAYCNNSKVAREYTDSIDWQDTSQSKVNVIFWHNDTNSVGDKGRNRPLVVQRSNQILNQAAAAWLRWAVGGNYTTQLMTVIGMPKPETHLTLDFSSLLGPLFYLWTIQLLFPYQLSQLVYEKEKRLRMMMKMHGLGDGTYWGVTYFFFFVTYVIFILILLIFGSAIGLKFFRLNSYGVQIVFYIVFINCQIAFTFLLSCCFTSSRTAVVVAFLYVFGTGLIGDILLSSFIESERWYVYLLELVPAFAGYRGLYEFSQYAFRAAYQNSKGVTFAKFQDHNMGMPYVFGVLIIEWPIFMLLAWYLEQVTSNGTGIRRHPLFCLPCFKRAHMDAGKTSESSASHVGVDVDNKMPTDVLEEQQRVADLSDFSDYPIVCKNLRKVYPAQDGNPPKIAVQTLSLAVQKGECFGLLGPNGAGKSTSINMMVGFLQPSSGTAVIDGLDIRYNMQDIYKLMGVCPQHDLLWDTLTAREHLLFYGRLKGMVGNDLRAAVDAALRSVNLFNNKVGDKQVKKYSGGMKRRLSVALSLIGSPRVVYMDEPSTGLDPASRRTLWDVVKAAKQGRAVVLTTHSMEEAEVLCDRLGIFVGGKLVCIGNPKQLTSRYGGYFVFTITVALDDVTAAEAFVKQLSPSARKTYELNGTLKFELPNDEVTLSRVFNGTARLKSQINVLDWAIANATLDEVFIDLAKSVGAESSD